ncbi:shewanella-like protein phosphatase 2, putative (SHLP2) [Plasmodium ovale curtisi]|uniref:Shewanella-like protein phosphatase 2, putative (SHLP2) n=1 Tax=Plasmodium ovale curtisi TaxID=864141 RepID=A0A1A8W772_PLAOA|nr:shewanella-like protein phosphatase 2, putative (SHLP2) [Plasmodium ovale curtisi]
MNMSYVKFFLLNYLAILWKINYVQGIKFSHVEWEHDFYSIGDLHGDKDAFLKILVNENIIDSDNNLVRENVLIVITGDVLDPGYDDIDVLFFIEEYNEKGKSMNSRILMTLGNHEVNNLCLQFKRGVDESKTNGESDIGNVGDGSALSGMINETEIERYRDRNNLFRKNEVVYNYLVKTPFVIKVNDIVFSHAGVLPFYAYYGIDFINQEGKREVENNCEVLMEKRKKQEEMCICCDYGPTLNRYYSSVNDSIFRRSMVCSTLTKALLLLNSNKMVIGHTVQKNYRVNSFCDEKLLLTDTGTSKWKNGVISYIEYFKDGEYNVKYLDRAQKLGFVNKGRFGRNNLKELNRRSSKETLL